MWRTLQTRFGTDPLVLEEAMVNRLAGGLVAPDDAPVPYRGVAAVLAALAAAPTEAELAGESAAVVALTTAVVSAPAPARRPRTGALRSTKVVGIAAALSSLSLVLGLAAAGALPGAAQRVASEALAEVGVSVPSPDDHSDGNADTRGGSGGSGGSGEPGDAPASEAGKGQEISETARTTDATGVDKGAQISDQASDGKSGAGEEPPATGPSAPGSLPPQAGGNPSPPADLPPQAGGNPSAPGSLPPQAGGNPSPRGGPPSLPDQASPPPQADNGLGHRP
jgi:hypothetical protein